MPKVTVIVPIYGVEKFIERCARSLFEQTLDGIEYIFINDCTPDCSIDILKAVLKEYPDCESHTRIVHMPTNLGLPTVRRYGVQLATGEYIIHCDSDDWVKLDMYEKMYIEAKRCDYDIVMCDFCIMDAMNISKEYKSKSYTDKFALLGALLSGKVHSSLCTKMVRSTLYNEAFIYPEDNMREDLCCTIQLIYNANSIKYLPMAMYNYYINESSICNALTYDKIYNKYKQSYNNYCKIMTFLQNHDLVNKYEREIAILKLCIKEEVCKIAKSKNGYKIWREIFPELSILDVLILPISFNMKLKIVLTYCGLYPF